MWTIIKAELSYNRVYLVSAYLATVVMWFGYLFDSAGMFPVFGVPAFFLMSAVYHFGIKERRERFLALLPVAVKHRSLALTLPFAILFHAAVLSGWLIQFLRARNELTNEFITFGGVLTLNGITVCIFLIVGIRLSLDFKKRVNRWGANILTWYFIAVGAALSLLFNIGLQGSQEFHLFLRNSIFHSPMVALAANAVCAGLIFRSMIVYTRRKSFL